MPSCCARCARSAVSRSGLPSGSPISTCCAPRCAVAVYLSPRYPRDPFGRKKERCMTTWLLEAFNTDRRYPDDVRYRVYTTSKRKAEAFDRIPKIQFTDSGHGIVFSASELPPRTRKLEARYGLADYVREHMEASRD